MQASPVSVYFTTLLPGENTDDDRSTRFDLLQPLLYIYDRPQSCSVRQQTKHTTCRLHQKISCPWNRLPVNVCPFFRIVLLLDGSNETLCMNVCRLRLQRTRWPRRVWVDVQSWHVTLNVFELFSYPQSCGARITQPSLSSGSPVLSTCAVWMSNLGILDRQSRMPVGSCLWGWHCLFI
jgi:hypothetical protein